MEFLQSLFLSLLQTPAVLLGSIAVLGLVLQRSNISEVVQGGIKTFVGFLILTGGAGILAGSLDPFAKMFQFALDVQGIVPSNEAIVAMALGEFGSATALIMFVGMVVNIILARLTRFKYIFLTGQVLLFSACLIAIIFETTGIGTDPLAILLGGLFEGTLLTVTPALCQPFMRKITGKNEFAMGHTSNLGYVAAGYCGRLFGDKRHSTEDIAIPQGISFLRDTTVSITLVMGLVYIVLALLTGREYIEHNLSAGGNYLVYSLVQAGTFAAGFAIVLYGIDMLLSQIVPAFHGIAERLVPNALPALDVPTIYPHAPNAVLIGFLVSFTVGTLSMFAMLAMHTVVIIPGIVGHFFCGAAAAIYGNAAGGRRGAIIGAAVYGLLVSWLPLVLLPRLGNLAQASSTFSDTDFLVPGILLGSLGSFGAPVLIGSILAFFVIVLILGRRKGASSEESST